MRTALAIRTSALLLAATAFAASGADWPQWRGPQRDGTSRETGLLKEWPKEGPRLLWQRRDAGFGYSTPAVVGERLFLLANEGLQDELVRALAVKDGQRVWQVRLGEVGNPKQNPNFPAARSTPTVDGQLLYALGSDGDLACVETSSGQVRWQKNLRRDFGGMPGHWAYAESPLVDGDRLVCTPGGSEATIVALDKNTGEVIWKSAIPGGDEAAYASAIIVETDGVRQYVQMLQKGLGGVDARTGKFLWRYDRTVSKYGANIPTPVAANGHIFSAGSGTGAGLIKLNVTDQTLQPEQVYFSPKLPTAIGGAVKVGDYLYGTSGQAMLCLNFMSGELKWEERALGAASLCYADERLYLHGENGEAALVEPTPQGYREKGRFRPPGQPERSNPMEKAWAYPVVSNGRLYLRDHNMLWCYDIATGSRQTARARD
jgi:outer membrane protein assembly factor BamB